MAKTTKPTVYLKPCAEHGKYATACFHNWGGPYLVIREVVFETFLLRHIKSGYHGLADQSVIDPSQNNKK